MLCANNFILKFNHCSIFPKYCLLGFIWDSIPEFICVYYRTSCPWFWEWPWQL